MCTLLFDTKGSDNLVEEIWLSDNYSSVFFSEKEVRDFLDSLVPKNGIPPRGMRVSFSVKKLKKRYTKRKVLMATPLELHEMLAQNNGSW